VRRSVRSLLVNLPLLLLSVGLATVLWAYVSHQQNPTLPRSLPFKLSSFEPENVPKSMIVTGQAPDDISVTLVGPRGAVNAIRSDDVALHVDLSSLDPNSPGSYTVPVKATVNKHGNRGIQVTIDPDTVRVTLEQIARRTVPVKVNVTDTPPVGFDLESPPAADPPEAVVSGLKQNVDAVEAVYADLKLTGLSVSTTVPLLLNPRNSDSRTISNVTVQPASASVKVLIARTLFTREAFVAVHTHGNPATGYVTTDEHSDPQSITIRGSLDALNGVTTIPTDDVEIEGATQDVRRVAALHLPPGVAVETSPVSAAPPVTPSAVTATPAPSTVVVTISILPERAPGSLAVAPRLLGQQVGQTYQLGTPVLIVTFSGPVPLVLALKPADFTATIDVGGLGPGTYSLDAKILLPPGLDRDTVTPSKVDITIVAVPTPIPTATAPSR
jgi:YbbR domain-containing protein